MNKNILVILGLSILLMLIAVQCSAGPAATQPVPAAPAAAENPAKGAQTAPAAAAAATAGGSLDGKALFEGSCSKCHGLDRATSKKKTADEWKTTVDRMVGKGAVLSAEEQAAVIEYLAATYPK